MNKHILKPLTETLWFDGIVLLMHTVDYSISQSY